MCLFSTVYLFGVAPPPKSFELRFLKVYQYCWWCAYFLLLQGEKTLSGGEILGMTKLCVYKISWKLSGKLSAMDIILKFKWTKLDARQ